MVPSSIRKVAFIGFGEAGGILGHDLAASGLEVKTFDILLQQPCSKETLLAKAHHSNVRVCESSQEAIAGADLVVSAVTASSATVAAKEAANALSRDQIFMDINSASPDTKNEIARVVEPSSATFVESAVMASVPPQRLKVPMLLGGKEAVGVAKLLQTIGFNATPVSDRIGVASAIKMCRSIVIKGLESLVVESLFAARRHGAEQLVLESLAATFPQMGWTNGLPEYMVSRVAEHGRRRANEMREVAHTLASVGLTPLMALATADRQDWLVDEMTAKNLDYHAGQPFSWRLLADNISQTEASAKSADGNGTASEVARSAAPSKNGH